MRAKVTRVSVYGKETELLMYEPKVMRVYEYANKYDDDRYNGNTHTSVYGKETEVCWRRPSTLSSE
jgi:hypothetical protein